MNSSSSSSSDHYDSFTDFQRTNTLGTVFLYIGLGFFSIFAGLFLISAWRSTTHKQRTYSVVSLIIVVVAATSYLAMAMGTGYIIRNDGRYIYYARYVDWAITTPLLLFDLGNFAGVGLPQIFIAMVFDVVMIVVGLFGALSNNTTRRWVWYGMGCLAFIPVLFLVLVSFKKYRVEQTRRPYTIQSSFLVVVWLLYPLVWGLGTGGNRISTDAETVWITILDILSKAVYGALWLTVFRSSLPYSEGEIADRYADASRHPHASAVPGGELQNQPVDSATVATAIHQKFASGAQIARAQG